jgi:hypothetical protein
LTSRNWKFVVETKARYHVLDFLVDALVRWQPQLRIRQLSKIKRDATHWNRHHADLDNHSRRPKGLKQIRLLVAFDVMRVLTNLGFHPRRRKGRTTHQCMDDGASRKLKLMFEYNVHILKCDHVLHVDRAQRALLGVEKVNEKAGCDSYVMQSALG